MTTDKQALVELAERCEAAEGPDRELDDSIRFITRQPFNAHQEPSYTASIDAALTLVPEGHHWQVGIGIETEFGHRDSAYAWCSQSDCGELNIAATPALALCVAALRALANPGEPQ